jgi:hypothetical protein
MKKKRKEKKNSVLYPTCLGSSGQKRTLHFPLTPSLAIEIHTPSPPKKKKKKKKKKKRKMKKKRKEKKISVLYPTCLGSSGQKRTLHFPLTPSLAFEIHTPSPPKKKKNEEEKKRKEKFSFIPYLLGL